MKFVDTRTLEILFMLLFQDNAIEIDYYWLIYHPGSFCDDLNELGIKDYLILETIDERTTIRLINIQGLENVLKKYLVNYRKGDLLPNSDTNYLCYSENLSKIKDVFWHYSNKFQQKSFILDSVELRNVFKQTEIGDKKLRLMEFILEIYFINLKNYINIVNAKLSCKALVKYYSLKIPITLLENPDKLYNSLLFQRENLRTNPRSGVKNYKIEKLIDKNYKWKYSVSYKNNDPIYLKTCRKKAFEYFLNYNHSECLIDDVINNLLKGPNKSIKNLNTYIYEINTMLRKIHKSELKEKYIKINGEFIAIEIP